MWEQRATDLHFAATEQFILCINMCSLEHFFAGSFPKIHHILCRRQYECEWFATECYFDCTYDENIHLRWKRRWKCYVFWFVPECRVTEWWCNNCEYWENVENDCSYNQCQFAIWICRMCIILTDVVSLCISFRLLWNYFWRRRFLSTFFFIPFVRRLFNTSNESIQSIRISFKKFNTNRSRSRIQMKNGQEKCWKIFSLTFLEYCIHWIPPLHSI